MKNTAKAINRDPDTQFLQRMGTALLLVTALMAGSVTVFGATTSRSDSISLWPAFLDARLSTGG